MNFYYFNKTEKKIATFNLKKHEFPFPKDTLCKV